MTNETETRRPHHFTTTLLPWFIAAGMFVCYALSVNQWVSVGSFAQITNLSGLSWRPVINGPVTFLVTYPMRFLPASLLPLAVNLFTMACAALTLGLLARSVALLPQDRTHEQRQREVSEHSYLTIRNAWLPPLFAALVLGLQMTFWEHATEATGEMIDLLIFAYLIRCLLEFRIERNEAWLSRFALVYGLGIANNWAMLAFLPAFFAAVVWVQGLSFFNFNFLVRSLGLWLAGLSLLFLMPALASLSATHATHAEFGAALHYLVAYYKTSLFRFPRSTLVLLGLTSVLPVFIISIKWSSFFGDTSPLGIFIATCTFHFVHALSACLWTILDSPLSPRQKGMGYPFLPLYYLAALSIGYLTGYFLLVFGTKVAKARFRPPPHVQFVNRCVLAVVWILLILTPVLLVYRNLPRILINQGRELQNYFALLEQSLPKKPAIILSDDTFRLMYLQCHLREARQDPGHLFVDTTSLWQDPNYFEYLEKRYPQFKLNKAMTNQLADVTQPLVLLYLMDTLSKDYEIYYLHPSFGYYFEEFYAEPRGLAYELKRFPDKVATTKPAAAATIAENREFWRRVEAETLPSLLKRVAEPEHHVEPTLMERLIKTAHLNKEYNGRAMLAGAFYSRSLNNWGVELHKCGLLREAGDSFSEAEKLNSFNISAQINHDFNLELQAKTAPVMQPYRMIEDNFGNRRSWVQVLGQDGPVDEPNFCYGLGETFYKGNLFRQSIMEFNRVCDYVPDYAPAHLWLSRLYITTQNYTNAVAETEVILRSNPDDTDALFLKGVSLMQLRSYYRAVTPLSRLLQLQADNLPAQLDRAMAYFQLGDLPRARSDYEAVGRVVTNSFQVFYGLGEIYYQQKFTNAAIRNYELYLTNAPPSTVEEIEHVTRRLKELKHDKS